METNKQREVIIACDFSSYEETLNFLDLFTEEKPFVKIGMELFYGEGLDIVKEVKRRGHKIFLDLKMHDIPNTVHKAMVNVAKLGVDLTSIHSAGTIRMMRAAQDAVEFVGSKTQIIAITQLTSTSQEVMQNELWIDHPINETVQHYALNAQQAGIAGVVCSPLEAGLVHEVCSPDFLVVTPGIRFAEDSKGDQVRVTTPYKAREIGSNYIVVGRSITASKNPVLSYRRCVKEFVEGVE